jgi:hypothetical protein
VPVQFVRDDWYRNVYAPRVQAAQAKQARDHWRAYGPQKRRGWDNDD